MPGAGIQTVTWRLTAQSKAETRAFTLGDAAPAGAVARPVGRRPIYLSASQEFAQVPVYERYSVPPGALLEGPLILQENESTIVLARTAKLEVSQNLTVSVALEPGHQPGSPGS